MDGNNQYNNSDNQYGQDGQYGQNNQFGQNGQYSQNNQYGQDGQYTQSNQYGQAGQYTQNSQYGQNGQYTQNDQNNPYGQYTQNPNGQYSNYQDYTANIPYQVPPNYYAADNATNGLQIAGLVCGILAICSSCCYGIPGVILGIAGLVCAIMGNRQSRNGVGTAGLVCSVVGLVCGLLMTAFWGVMIWEIIMESMY